MGGGSSTPASTTQTREMPVWARPYSMALLQRSAALADQPMPVYQGQRTADMNGYQTAGMNMVANRALNGSPEMMAGSQNIYDTLNGGYLAQGNPYLQSQIDRASQDVTRNYQGAVGSTDATFARSGAFGGSAWQQAQEGNARQLAQGLGDVASSMRYQNYGDERGRQMQALGMAPTYGNQAYQDAQQLQGVGQQQYAFDQQRFDDMRSVWEEMAQSPYKQLDVLANGLSGAVGNSGTISQSAPGANRLAQGVGTAAALYGLLG